VEVKEMNRRNWKGILILLFVITNTIVMAQAQEGGEFIYYGYVPSRIWQAIPVRPLHGGIDITAGFTINNLTITKTALLAVTALQDDTVVKVFELKSGKILGEGKINNLESFFLMLKNGTFFKIVTNKLANVLVLASRIGEVDLNPDLNEGPVPTAYYPSTDGSYAGKEFVILASQGFVGTPYRVLALEDSDVSIMTKEGTKILSFSLKANSWKDITLQAFKVYKITSTRNIMIQSGGPGGRSFYIPAIDGGYLGTAFYSISLSSWDPVQSYGFRIDTFEETKVTIYDVMAERVLEERKLPANSAIYLKPVADEIFIQSDKPITLMFVHHGAIKASYGWAYGAGVTYTGVKAKEKAVVYVPENTTLEAFIFSNEEAIVSLDGATFIVKADIPFPLTAGRHEIESDHNLIVQVVHWPLEPDFQGIPSFGVVVPPIQNVGLKAEVRLTPIIKPLPLQILAIGIVLALVIISIAFLKHRKA
jgi:hypothetical protein